MVRAYQQTHASRMYIHHLYLTSQGGIQCLHGRGDQAKEIRGELKYEGESFINTPVAMCLYMMMRGTHPEERIILFSSIEATIGTLCKQLRRHFVIVRIRTHNFVEMSAEDKVVDLNGGRSVLCLGHSS